MLFFLHFFVTIANRTGITIFKINLHITLNTNHFSTYQSFFSQVRYYSKNMNLHRLYLLFFLYFVRYIKF